MKKNYRIILSVVILFIGLTSCSNLPSPFQNENDLRNKIEKVSENKVELIQFEKTNALEKEIFGVKCYTVSYKGKIRYKENGYLCLDLFNKDYLLNLVKVKKTSFYSIAVYYDVKQDEEKQIIGRIIYTKTENGWIAANGDIVIKEDKNIK
jgi:hypothetical protein